MKQQLEIKKQLITPAIASELLKANVSNRRIKEPVVLRYSNDMKSGRWKENTAEMIKISDTGAILDGQHRLKALVMANVSLYFYVATNVPNDVFDVLDTGSNRNASDVFYISGVKNDRLASAIIAFYNSLKLNQSSKAQKNNRMNNSQLLEQYYDREDFWSKTSTLTINWYKSMGKLLSPSHLGGFYAYLYDIDANMAMSFISELASGFNVKNNIVLLLRNKLIQDATSYKKMLLSTKIALIIKAWNFYVSGKCPKLLKFDANVEPYPIVTGRKHLTQINQKVDRNQ